MGVGALLQWGQTFVSKIISPTLAAAAGGLGAAGHEDTSHILTTVNNLLGQYMSILGKLTFDLPVFGRNI